jgi:putative RecB family exonuclease
MTAQALKLVESMKNRLHISFSQLNMFLNCPLKYKFKYVEGQKPDTIGSGLIFGKAIHESAAVYYRSIMDGDIAPESVADQVFEEAIQKSLDESPVTFKKGEDQASILTKGKELISLLYKRERTNKVLLVEHPVATMLTDDITGEVSDNMALFGILDLVEEDDEGNRIIVDLKTSATRYDDFKVQSDQQMTFYAELAVANGLMDDSNGLFRFDVLLKQKTPSLESYYTVRSADDRRRLKRTLTNVLHAIEVGCFYPNPNWMCQDCGFKAQCKDW